MCGIAGLLKKDGSVVSELEIKELTDLIAHRGPDDEGFFLNDNFALGHRRLSILDLSSAGHQPMSYGNATITFNGEIYNYIEIREELKKAGFTFKTQTDTEVLIAAYIYWGEDCVTHFNGMWSFAIWDSLKNILFCSRDRFGIKPFYYVNDSSIFSFGSEIKQLHSLGFSLVNLSVLFDYLYVGYLNHTSETFFRYVHQLEPSHNLIYDITSNTIAVRKYYQLEFKSEIHQLNLQAAEDYYESLLKRSINLRLRSDVKVGACLSGGLDSSYIASVASHFYREASGKCFTSITARSGDPSNDETHFAKMVIEKANLDGKIITPNLDNIFNDIEDIVYHQEEPFGGPSIFMQYYVMKTAKELGCVVLLDGQGGDETLLGYERYYMSFLRNLTPLNFIRWFKKIAANSKLNIRDVAQYYLYFSFSGFRANHLRKRMHGIRKEYKQDLNNELIREYAKASQDLFNLQKLEVSKTQLRALLNYEDKNSMAWSIETRLPFIDYKVVEAALSIKSEHKINDGWSKYLLRKIGSKVLPQEIAWRKNKIGFEAPPTFWKLPDEFDQLLTESPILNAIFEDVKDIKDTKLFWKVLSISLWERKFNMKI